MIRLTLALVAALTAPAGVPHATAATTPPTATWTVTAVVNGPGMWPDDTIRARVAATAAYWSTESAGHVTIRLATITRLPDRVPVTGCQLPPVWDAADTAAGWQPAPGQALLILDGTAAANVDCPYGGFTSAAGRVWVAGAGYVTHELGHVLGLGHATTGPGTGEMGYAGQGEPTDCILRRVLRGGWTVGQTALLLDPGDRVTLAPLGSATGLQCALIGGSPYTAEYRPGYGVHIVGPDGTGSSVVAAGDGPRTLPDGTRVTVSAATVTYTAAGTT